MKDKPNEWVSISDLMSGVMAVVMLLLVMSVLQKTYSDSKHQQESEQGIAAKKKVLDNMLNSLQSSVANQSVSNIVAFDIENSKITLKESVFERGSACITPTAKSALNEVQNKVNEFLLSNPTATVVIEGHTDSAIVTAPVTDITRFCTVYDDNFTLSAARAREARKVLIGKLSEKETRRLIVAGYGDSQPLDNLNSEDPKNRRVEIQFTIK